MYNSGRRGKRTSDGYGVISTADNFNQNEYPIPTVTSFSVTDGSYNPLPDTAVDTAGGQTIVINGSGFRPGATVMVGGTTIGAVTYLDQGRLAFTAPSLSSASYTIFVINSNGGTGILLPGLVYSGLPTWTTSAGSIGSVYETKPISQSFAATGDAPLTYALYSGTLPSGSTLGSDGTLSGTAPVDSGSTTYSFTIRAYDAQNQHSDRSFSLTINTDVVTWSTPDSEQVINAYEYRPITNVTASATSAAGYGVLYAANTVPGNITLDANTGLISGNMGVAGNTYTQLTATANTTVRNATRNVIFNAVQDVVTWSTPNTNQVISSYEYSPISNVTANATSAAGFGVLYSSNAIPTGITIDANTGLISGTANTSGNTYSRLTATANTTSRSNTQDIIFNVNQDVVTWSSPPDQITYAVQGGAALSNVTMSATSAAGRSITYTANALPSGVGISGSTIYGTPDTAQTVTTLLTATADTTNRSATRTIYWSIALGDSYLNNNTLLLKASSDTFSTDASVNNYQFNINGDTRPNNFGPFGGNYYSYFWPGGGPEYLTTTGSGTQFGSGDFTIECWIKTNDPSAGGLFGDRTAQDYNGMSVKVSSGKIALLMSTDGVSFAVSGSSTSNINLGVWNHIAITRSGTTVYVYINGVQNVMAGTLTGTLSQTSGLAYIGADVADNSYFKGYISNYRIVKGTALYTSNFTPSTTPLTTTSQGATASQVSLLTCQSIRYTDNSIYNLSLTKTGDIQQTLLNPFSIVSANNSGSVYFDGVSDSLISTGDANSFDFGSDDWTIEFWIYTTSTAEQHVFAKRAATGVYSPLIVGITGNRLYILGSTSGTGWEINSGFSTGSIPVPVYSWNHIAVVRSGSTITGYVNGVSDVSYSVSGAFMTNATAMTIGVGTTSLNNPVVGYISNFRIIKGTALYTTTPFTVPTSPLTAITNTQLLICQSKNSTSSNVYVDTSGLNNIINKFGNATQSTFTPYGDNWSYYFGASNPTLLSSTNSNLILGSSDWTIEAWVYMNSITNAFYVVSNRFTNGTGNTNGPTLLINAGKLYARDQAGALIVSTPTTFEINKWYHVALCRSGNNVYAFINGTQEGTTFTYGSPPTYVANQIQMGYESAFGVTADTGYVSNLRMINGTALYTSNFNPPSSPLTAVANTVLLTSNNNRLYYDGSFNNLTFTRSGDISAQKHSPFAAITLPKYYSTYFDGTGDYLTAPYVAGAYDFGTNNFTVELWINTSSVASGRGILDKRPVANTTGWIITQPSADPTKIRFAGGDATPNVSFDFDITSTSSIVVGTWYHIAAVRNGSTFTLYMNGVSQGTATYAGAVAGTGTNALSIGAILDGTLPFNGHISNLRIVNGTALYTSNFTPSTTPLTAVANTVLLTCQSDMHIDNSNNNFTISVSGETIPRTYSPFTPTPTLSQIYDPSIFGTSIYLDGTGDSLRASNNVTYSFRNSDFTMEAWSYFNSTGNYGDIMSMTSGATIFGIRWGNGGFGLKLQAGAINSSTTCFSSSALQGTYGNTWVHVAWTRQANTCRLFLNGTQQYVASGINPTSYPSNTFNSTIDFGTSTASTLITIGGSGYASTWRGHVADPKVTIGKALYTSNFCPPTTPLGPSKTIGANTYNSSFSLASNPVGIYDASRNVSLETVGNTIIVKRDPFSNTGSSIYFDGAGDYLNVSDIINPIWNLGSGNFTIEAWVYPNNVSGARTILQRFTTWSTSVDFHLSIEASGSIYWNCGNNNFISTANNVVTAAAWNHIAVVRNNTIITVYAGGVPQGNVTIGTTALPFSPARPIRIGANDTGTNAFNGYLKDLRVTRGIARYTSTFTPPTSELITK